MTGPSTSPEARDELANEFADAYVEALGEPAHVLHNDGEDDPHIDVYVYAPEDACPAWLLVTAGRSTEPVGGRHVELVVRLRPETDLDDVAEMAEVLRQVALGLDRPRPGWTFKPVEEETYLRLGRELRHSPTFVGAVFKKV